MSKWDTCVLIPYKETSTVLDESVEILLKDNDQNLILLVDDGSSKSFEWPTGIKQPANLKLLRSDITLGPAGARNMGIAFCRDADVEILILLDSDCLPQEGFIDSHRKLHQQHKDATCIGGAIQGVGNGFWAKLDGVASWFTSVPGNPMREVKGIYHIPTTNMSIKLDHLHKTEPFDSNLKTGEDVKFIHGLLAEGRRAVFNPLPQILHFDRDSFSKFFIHQFRWGLHTYVIRSSKIEPLFKRIIIAAVFTFLIPAFALVSTGINLYPLMSRSLGYLAFAPFLFMLYACKGAAVMYGTINPHAALYSTPVQ